MTARDIKQFLIGLLVAFGLVLIAILPGVIMNIKYPLAIHIVTGLVCGIAGQIIIHKYKSI